MRVLVTGGAGYIGSAVTAMLTRHGYDPVRFDVAPDPAPELGPFVTADVCDVDAVVRAMRDHAIAAVVHLAGYIAVGESVAEPLRYWDNNVRGALSLLEAMRTTGVRRVVFSSSAAVYGDPVEIPIPETHPIAPASPYGRTKWVVEQILQDVAEAGEIDYAALRYFNAAGAMAGVPGERHDPETHLIPNVLEAARGGPMLFIYGTDYPTPDGTAVRDYVHVEDLAEAHVLALRYLERQGPSGAFNIANSRGYSVYEVVRMVEASLHRDLPMRLNPRRPGDPGVLIGSSERARSVLGWNPKHETLESIVESLLPNAADDQSR